MTKYKLLGSIALLALTGLMSLVPIVLKQSEIPYCSPNLDKLWSELNNWIGMGLMIAASWLFSSSRGHDLDPPTVVMLVLEKARDRNPRR